MANINELIDTPESVDEKPGESQTENSPFDLSELLSGYKEPAITETTKAETPVEQKQPETSQTNTMYPGMPVWYGNPLYYQSGKKQGQLKPPPKNGLKNAFQPANVSVNPAPSVLTADQIISGALCITMINLLLPMAFALANNLIVGKKDKKKIMSWEDLQLDNKATKDLELLADKALKHIKIDANPVGIFLIALLGVYSMQFMTVKMLTEQSQNLNKNDNNKMAGNK